MSFQNITLTLNFSPNSFFYFLPFSPPKFVIIFFSCQNWFVQMLLLRSCLIYFLKSNPTQARNRKASKQLMIHIHSCGICINCRPVLDTNNTPQKNQSMCYRADLTQLRPLSEFGYLQVGAGRLAAWPSASPHGHLWLRPLQSMDSWQKHPLGSPLMKPSFSFHFHYSGIFSHT